MPFLYAGETFEAAVYETIFHDVPARAIHYRLGTLPLTMRRTSGAGNAYSLFLS